MTGHLTVRRLAGRPVQQNAEPRVRPRDVQDATIANALDRNRHGRSAAARQVRSDLWRAPRDSEGHPVVTPTTVLMAKGLGLGGVLAQLGAVVIDPETTNTEPED